LIALLTLLNVPLTLVPSEVTIVMQATRIRASITAYSTAVGPSSLTRNRRTEFRVFIGAHLCEESDSPERWSVHPSASQTLRGLPCSAAHTYWVGSRRSSWPRHQEHSNRSSRAGRQRRKNRRPRGALAAGNAGPARTCSMVL